MARFTAGRLLMVTASLAAAVHAAARSTAPLPVEVVRHDEVRRVDVTIGGRPFTSYVWPAALAKPVLFPILTARGTAVTRGYPLEPRPGERVDHPHHVGLWFNYGNINGVDFWNHPGTLGPPREGRLGTIVHREILEARGGSEAGTLVTTSDWRMPDGAVVLNQTTTYVFRGTAGERTIDLHVTLTAQDAAVAFDDNKEGVLGLRVARALEEPLTKPERLTDAQGHPTDAPVLDNTGVNGEYLTSEGVRGAAVWGTRAKWCRLSGTVAGEAISIAILDHPSNPGFPTYWHARGYGLFAANPLGQKELSGGKDVLRFSLPPAGSASFRYRVVVASHVSSPSDLEAAWTRWAASGAKRD